MITSYVLHVHVYIFLLFSPAERNHWNIDLDFILKISQKECRHSFSCAKVISKYVSLCRFCIRLCFKSMNKQAERFPSRFCYVFKSLHNSKIRISRQIITNWKDKTILYSPKIACEPRHIKIWTQIR
jgi:hypothetical protein